MKATACRTYGPPEVLLPEDIRKPVPGDDAILIKVHCTAVTPLDWHLRSGKPFLVRIAAGGLRKRGITILGFDVGGEIESTGRSVQRFKQGDPVCGLMPISSNGANADYICVPLDSVLPLSVNLTHEEAASVPSTACVALRFLGLGGIRSRQRVLVNGAFGGLGTQGVQLARHFGADISAVCGAANLDMVRSLGAN